MTGEHTAGGAGHAAGAGAPPAAGASAGPAAGSAGAATPPAVDRRRRRPTVEELAAGVLEGNRAKLSQAITLAESRRPADQALAQELIARVLPHTGGSRRIGLTGVPGAGKSTTIEALGAWLVEQGHKVAVLTIDPSSARSGGSILGDKTRMQKLSMLENAYIRPSPSSGVLGGVARRTREAMLLCEAAGFDVVIVESVGVGQSEAVLADLVDCCTLLLVPGAGDDLQGIKRGIMEIADVVVVNKADGDRLKLARRAASDYRHALHLLPPATPGWETVVLTFSAVEGTGLVEFWQAVEGHREHLESDGALGRRRDAQQLKWLHALVDEAVLTAFHARPGVPEAMREAEAAVTGERQTVPQATAQVLEAAGFGELAEALTR